LKDKFFYFQFIQLIQFRSVDVYTAKLLQITRLRLLLQKTCFCNVKAFKENFACVVRSRDERLSNWVFSINPTFVCSFPIFFKISILLNPGVHHEFGGFFSFNCYRTSIFVFVSLSLNRTCFES
jgi:hypothetical protein